MTLPLSKLNYITVGPGGTFKPYGNPEYLTAPADVDAVFASLRGKKKILLYFHGGLVNEESGMQTAASVTEVLTQGTDVHPVSFIWETGLMETIGQNLQDIWSTVFFRKLLEKVIKVAGGVLGISVDAFGMTRGVGGLSYAEINTELAKEAPFEDYSVDSGARSPNLRNFNERYLRDEIEAEIELELEDDSYFRGDPLAAMSLNELAKLDTDRLLNRPVAGERALLSVTALVKASVTIIYKVVKRFREGRDHGFYPTVVEEILREVYVADIGTWVWGEMKSKAEAMWRADDAGVPPLEQHAGAYFLSGLKKYAAENEGVTVDLVGHSAGSIAICHFITAFYHCGVAAKIRNTVFMAPACTSSLFHGVVVRDGADIGHFRMFTMADGWECRDRCVPYVYTRSLLYMISGILEKDEFDAYVLGMQRYLLGNAPYGEVPVLNDIMAFIGGVPDSAVYAVTAAGAAGGLQCIAQHHGGFADPAVLTMGSIIYLLHH